MNPKRVLITGAAGFIGASLMSSLEKMGIEVLGLDNFSSFYSSTMKRERISDFHIAEKILEIDIADRVEVASIFGEFRPDIVVNLAAQGGVRASKEDPAPYIITNQLGFLNVLQCSQEYGVKRFIYASSSSVYGDGLEAPFSEDSSLPELKSLYALSKYSNELIAKYLPIENLEVVGLRFFTVYGPWGRPDMAVFRLLAASYLGKPFDLTANLDVARDFTFINDVTLTITQLLSRKDNLKGRSVLNVAGSRPRTLRELLSAADSLGCLPKIIQFPSDPLDAKITHGSTSKLFNAGLHVPNTTLEEGLEFTWSWLNTIDRNHVETWYDNK